MKNWLLGITFGLVILCLMSWMDDGYQVQVAANQDIIEAQQAARIEAADRELERDYLMAKANWMTNGRGMKCSRKCFCLTNHYFQRQNNAQK